MIKHPRKDSASPVSTDDRDLPTTVLTTALTPTLMLGVDDVHVWQAKLDDHDAGSLRSLLAQDEVSRANRFHFAKDRDHFIVARALLRKLLAAYLRLDPAEVEFGYADKGKPFLLQSEPSVVSFNLAHSHGMALYAFAQNREVGVDVEFIREDLESEKIAERFFSPGEIETLLTVPVELRKQAFFNCWTRKEAYIKARGEGLSLPLDEFDVSLRPGESAALLQNHKDAKEVARWTMRSISVPAGYVAAVVVEGQDCELQTFALEPG